MRRIAFLATLALALTGLGVSPAAALVSIGIHGGFDLNGQDAQDLATTLSNDHELTLEREEIKAPLMGGVHLLIDATPIVDLEFGVEGSLRKYHVMYEDIDLSDLFDEDIYFGRISVYGSAKMTLLNLPLVKGYGGAGLGYHVVTPLLSRDLLDQKIAEEGLSGDALKPEDIISREGVIGAHLLAGLRFKPAFLPLALSAEGRYYFLAENDYGDDTNRFFSMVFGIDLGF